MSMDLIPYSQNYIVDRNWIETLILKLADIFDVRVVWDGETAIITGVCALAGGLLGGYGGGRLGAAIGAGIGGAAGLGVATVVSLREIWSQVKEKLRELTYIVLNFLRGLDPIDYMNAAEILLASYGSRRELVLSILDFVAHKLGREVLSSIAAA